MTRHIIGPPFIVARFMRFLELEEIPLTLDPESMIIMLGGWKQYTGVRSAAMSSMRGRTPPRRRALLIRDMYGMIESDMLAIECEHHRKHVPRGVTCPSATSLTPQSNSSRVRPAGSPFSTHSTPPIRASCSPMMSARSTRATANVAAPGRRCDSAAAVTAPNSAAAR